MATRLSAKPITSPAVRRREEGSCEPVLPVFAAGITDDLPEEPDARTMKKGSIPARKASRLEARGQKETANKPGRDQGCGFVKGLPGPDGRGNNRRQTKQDINQTQGEKIFAKQDHGTGNRVAVKRFAAIIQGKIVAQHAVEYFYSLTAVICLVMSQSRWYVSEAKEAKSKSQQKNQADQTSVFFAWAFRRQGGELKRSRVLGNGKEFSLEEPAERWKIKGDTP